MNHSDSDRPRRFWLRPRRVAMGMFFAVAVALPIAAEAEPTLMTRTDAVAPDVPADSAVFVFNIANAYDPGDVIAYREGDVRRMGRVVRDGTHTVRVERNGEGARDVSHADILGKVVVRG